jgi:hypothetical protein
LDIVNLLRWLLRGARRKWQPLLLICIAWVVLAPMIAFLGRYGVYIVFVAFIWMAGHIFFIVRDGARSDPDQGDNG